MSLTQKLLIAERQISVAKNVAYTREILDYTIAARSLPFYKSLEHTSSPNKLKALLSVPWLIPIISYRSSKEDSSSSKPKAKTDSDSDSKSKIRSESKAISKTKEDSSPLKAKDGSMISGQWITQSSSSNFNCYILAEDSPPAAKVGGVVRVTENLFDNEVEEYMMEDPNILRRQYARDFSNKVVLVGFTIDGRLLMKDVGPYGYDNTGVGALEKSIAIMSLIDTGADPSISFPHDIVGPIGTEVHDGTPIDTWAMYVQSVEMSKTARSISPLSYWMLTHIEKEPRIEALYYQISNLLKWAINSTTIDRHLIHWRDEEKTNVVVKVEVLEADYKKLVKYTPPTRTHTGNVVNAAYLRKIYTNNGKISIKKAFAYKKIDFERINAILSIGKKLTSYARERLTLRDPLLIKLIKVFQSSVKIEKEKYVDAESGVFIMCTHQLYTLFTGKRVIDTYGILSKKQYEILCRVCSAVLEGEHYISETGSSPHDSMYADTILFVVNKFIDYNVIKVTVGRYELFTLVTDILANPIGEEEKKLVTKTPTERQNKIYFIVLSAITTLLYTASMKTKHLVFNKKSLRKMFQEEYVELIATLGFSVDAAMTKAMNYWTSGLYKRFSNPTKTIESFVIAAVKAPSARYMQETLNAQWIYIMRPLLKEKHPIVLNELRDSDFKDKPVPLTTKDMVESVNKGIIPSLTIPWWSRIIIKAYTKGLNQEEYNIFDNMYLIYRRADTFHFPLYKPREVGKRAQYQTKFSKTSASDDVTSFSQDLAIICPARTVYYLPHYWKIVHNSSTSKCTYCGIVVKPNGEFDVTPAYYKKYKSFMLGWKAKAPPKTLKEMKITSPLREYKAKPDAKYDTTILARFAKKYGKPLKLSTEGKRIMMLDILSKIGFLQLGEALIKNQKYEYSAWNALMGWANNSPKESTWLHRNLTYFNIV